MIKFTCPICERHIYDKTNWPHIPSTPWTNNCCCCDQNYCVAHQMYSYGDRPDRPPDEELLKRAEARAEREKEIFDQNLLKVQRKAEQMEKLSELALEIKEYFGWTFETFEEFKREADDMKKSMYLQGYEDGKTKVHKRY